MSKELFPIGFQPFGEGAGARPKVACHYLLERMRSAGMTEAFIILRPGKWDIPAYLGDGGLLGMRLAYLTVHVPFGVPFSLDQAYPFVREATVALGFPDILFQPDDAFQRLLARQYATDADVVLGLFPTDQPEQVGVVDFDGTGRVSAVIEKSSLTHLRYMWALAVWQPRFTEFLHRWVESKRQVLIGHAAPQALQQFPPHTELPMGDVIQAGIQAGLRVEAEVFESGQYFDIGTPENLTKAIHYYGKSLSP
jgi:glucose-1-phosphate thymidylyltransferase